MNFQEARTFIEGAAPEIHMGLDRLEELLLLLGSPERKLSFVHLAGSNGKGSTLACITAMLRENGLKTGCFFSPAMADPLERFQVNGKQISRDLYTELAQEICSETERMKARGHALPSAFEKETALAFLYFVKMQCQIVVLECGMGGFLDATNVIPAPEAAVLLPISLEHRAFLGNTLREIAGNKAGIIKAGTTVITAPQEAEAFGAICEKCAACGCRLIEADPAEAELLEASPSGLKLELAGTEAFVPLAGLYQRINVLTAWKCCQILTEKGWPLEQEKMKKGLAKVFWPGRFQRIGQDPDVILDGAHNPAGVRELLQTLDTYYPGCRVRFLLGVFRDKDHGNMLKILLPRAAGFYVFDLPWTERTLPAGQLAEEIAALSEESKKTEYSGERPIVLQVCASPEQALEMARRDATEGEVIIACGSLSYLSRLYGPVAEDQMTER